MMTLQKRIALFFTLGLLATCGFGAEAVNNPAAVARVIELIRTSGGQTSTGIDLLAVLEGRVQPGAEFRLIELDDLRAQKARLEFGRIRKASELDKFSGSGASSYGQCPWSKANKYPDNSEYQWAFRHNDELKASLRAYKAQLATLEPRIQELEAQIIDPEEDIRATIRQHGPEQYSDADAQNAPLLTRYAPTPDTTQGTAQLDQLRLLDPRRARYSDRQMQAPLTSGIDIHKNTSYVYQQPGEDGTLKVWHYGGESLQDDDALIYNAEGHAIAVADRVQADKLFEHVKKAFVRREYDEDAKFVILHVDGTVSTYCAGIPTELQAYISNNQFSDILHYTEEATGLEKVELVNRNGERIAFDF